MTKIWIDRGRGFYSQLSLECGSAEAAIDAAIAAAQEKLDQIGNEQVYRHPLATGEAQCRECELCFSVNVAPAGDSSEMSSVLINPSGSGAEQFVTVFEGRPQVTSVKLPGNLEQVCKRHVEG